MRRAYEALNYRPFQLPRYTIAYKMAHQSVLYLSIKELTYLNILCVYVHRLENNFAPAAPFLVLLLVMLK